MKKAAPLSALFYLLFCPLISAQQDLLSEMDTETDKSLIFGGFIRGGFYAGIDKNDDKLYFPSAFSDAGLTIESDKLHNYKAFADIRFRYGTEFEKQANKLDIREGYVTITQKRWDLTAGQKIIKWGRADFTNPVSKLSPRNLINRSPDREDMDMANLLLGTAIYPSDFIRIEAVAVPFYRSSVLITGPVPLPGYVKINDITSLLTDKKYFSYGLKADFHVRGFDWSVSWFNGFDPMPGIALSLFELDMSGPMPFPNLELTVRPYKNRVLGLDFETTAGQYGLRGEAAWSVPEVSWKTNEYVPLPEIKYVAGIDWSGGIWRFTGEYSGKYIPDFEPSSVDPVIGTSADFSEIAQLMSDPGFDVEAYVRQQTGAFNRLYNYQLKRIYHSAAIKSEAELIYGKLLPSLLAMYNFTSRDLLIIPEIKIKPSDGLAITAGAEIYSGPSGSLYELVNDFMNSVYISLRVDF